MTSTIIVSSGVTSDTIVSGGVLMDVFNSGSTLSITVTNGGTQSVYSGGVANQTTVDYGGILSVGSGGIANAVTVNEGGAEYVFAGGVVGQTTLTNGASQYLAAGASATGTEILHGGTEYVSSGATATDTLVKDGHISVGAGGTTLGAKLGPAGNELVGPNGFASRTIIVGGTLRLEGGKASGTIVEGQQRAFGQEYVLNGASEVGAVVGSNGEQVVQYGTTTGTILSGGGDNLSANVSYENVSSGGVAYGTRMYVGSYLTVAGGGRAIDTIVESGGYYVVDDIVQTGGTSGLLVSSGGTEGLLNYEDISTSATILAGGHEFVGEGKVFDTKLYGSSIVNAFASSTSATIMSGGSEQVVAAGSVIDSTVMSGGFELVDAYGFTSNSTVMSGGYESVQSNGIIENATIAGGVLDLYTSTFSGGVTFTGSGGELKIETFSIPSISEISGFAAGDSVVLPNIYCAPGATAVVTTPGVVTILNGGPQYNLNIAGAYVGESDFVFTSAGEYSDGSILTKSSTPQMQFLRPHVAPTDTGLNLTPSLDMLTNPSTTTRPAAAPSMAASTSATIAPVPHLVTSAPHPLVVPPHGV